MKKAIPIAQYSIETNKDTTYISEVLSWHSEYDNNNKHKSACEKDLVKLTLNDKYPHYYLEYNEQRYPLYSYAETLSIPITFWYELFENRNKKCSFVFFSGNNTAQGIYTYTIFDIADSLTISGFYQINERELSNSKQMDNDTIAIMKYAKISCKAKDFLASSNKIPNTQAIHYFLRKEQWLSKPKNKEEHLIMKHYEFIKAKM